MITYATLLVAAVIGLFGLAAMGALNLPLAAIALGFVCIGYAMPGLLEGTTKYSKTLWLPLGFVVAGAFGSWLVFQDSAFQVIFGAQWCPIAPCIPIGWLIASLVIGDGAKLAALHLTGEKLDLFGEHVKD